MPTVTAIIGLNIRVARTRHRITQAELAERLNMAEGTISAIERGARVITVNELLPICRSLDVDLRQLLEGLDRAGYETLGITPPR